MQLAEFKLPYFVIGLLAVVPPDVLLADAADSCGLDNGERECIVANIVFSNINIKTEGTKMKYNFTNEQGVVVLNGEIGTTIPEIVGPPIQGDCDGQTSACLTLSWKGVAEAVIRPVNEKCIEISWTTETLSRLEDCFDIGDAFWYGGPEEKVQHFPMRLENARDRVPYLPGDMLQDEHKYFGGVAEPYWLNSKGGAVRVAEEQPLFYSWNMNGSAKLCLSSANIYPYPTGEDRRLHFNYVVCGANDAKEMQEFAATNLWTRPTSTPDELMMTEPIWSTWAQYKTQINETIVKQFADDILRYGFTGSQVEIDDNWETFYGDASFEPGKFPNPAAMVADLKDKGFRVTLWIHPFINMESNSFIPIASPPMMYMVRDPKGRSLNLGSIQTTAYLPGLTWWWQGLLAGCLDFTNPEAVQWWSKRLENIRTEVGVDSFKFDAGEYNWLPTSYMFNQAEDVRTWPGIYSTRYVESVAAFGKMIEVRTGRFSQHLPIFVRMLDKDSTWGYDNGLKSMVTTLLQFGTVGYPFVLPDMIGGNGYGGMPSRELYIRWLQVNVFMPAVQISYVPWLYDEEVVQHARDMVDLHARYAPQIINLAQEAIETGLPINRPVWWVDPMDQEALRLDSQFLLGDDLLVAPVLEEEATTRDVYLPKGTWLDMNSQKSIDGPVWLIGHPADLFTLPYFTRLST